MILLSNIHLHLLARRVWDSINDNKIEETLSGVCISNFIHFIAIQPDCIVHHIVIFMPRMSTAKEGHE